MSVVFEFLVYGSVTLFLYWCYGIYKKNKQLKHIPGPPPIPFIGLKLPMNIYEINTFFDNLRSKYGRTFKYYIGNNLTIGTCDADLVQAILQSTVHIRKSTVYDLTRPWLRNGLIVSFGEKWAQRRKFTNPSFHVSILKEFFLVFKDSADLIVKKIQEEADRTDVIDVLKFMAKFSLDVVAETSFGVKLDLQKGQNKAYIDSINFMTGLVHSRNFSPWKRFNLLFKWFAKEYTQQEKALDILDTTTMKVIEKKREQYKKSQNHDNENETIRNKKKAILLDALMEHSEMSNADIYEEIANFLFAGYETVSTSASATIYQLAAHPDIQEKVYQEIMFFTKNDINNLTFEIIQKMTYLDKVIKETLRIISPLALIERRVTEDAKFGDTVFPKGTTFSILLYWLHKDEQYFPNPQKFDPERFTPEEQAKRHPFAYVPFSAGPRNCIGQKYGMLEVKTVLIRIIMEFGIFPVEDNTLVIGISGVLKSKYGFPVRLQRRKIQKNI